jgi:thiol-disulfide isomerase/thioredoxin
MNSFIATILFLSFFGNDTGSQSKLQTPITADEVLKKTSANLNKCNTIRYLHERDYFTGDKHYFLKGNVFIDFNSADTIIRLKYQCKTEGYEFFYNGTESFSLDKKSKSLNVNNKPAEYDMEGGNFFDNSLVSLRRTLPLIIADQSIKKELQDTLINNTAYYLVRFTLFKKILKNFGGYFPLSEERTFDFRLVITKNTFLPFSLLQSNNADEHTNKTTFTGIETNTEIPKEESWYYSTYLNEYVLAAKKKEVPLLSVGLEAPSFELPQFNSNETVKSAEYKNKVVLVEFWIRNCGPCIASVPKLNSLQDKFKNRGLEIIAVNPYDEKPTITYFVNKYAPRYRIAFNGEKSAKQFGVSAFPVVFIINKKGKIVYSGGFDNDLISEILEGLL